MTTQEIIPTLHQLQYDVVTWANRVFPNRTPKDVLIKSFEELGEMIKNPTDVTEAADVLILILDFVNFYDIDGNDLALAVKRKMEVNKARQWAVDRRTGIMQHV